MSLHSRRMPRWRVCVNIELHADTKQEASRYVLTRMIEENAVSVVEISGVYKLSDGANVSPSETTEGR